MYVLQSTCYYNGGGKWQKIECVMLCSVFPVVLVELTELDYQQREGQGNNMITARVLYNREIANPITVTFFPVTYDRYENDLNLQLPSSFPGRMVEADGELVVQLVRSEGSCSYFISS